MPDVKIFILLSSKCSGSTALQSYLELNYGMTTIDGAGHFEKETLYWTKVASVLGLPQEPLHRSVVPFPAARAHRMLQSLVEANGLTYTESSDKKRYFEYFFELAKKSGTCVVEKSPHHIFNQSNIDLILEFREYIRDRAEVYIIGLVRHPFDVIYSAWKRWRFNCSAFEREWVTGYRNLSETMTHTDCGAKLFLYESIVASTVDLDAYLSQAGIPQVQRVFDFNSKSLKKWKTDSRFLHRLSPQTMALALTLGYTQDQLEGQRRPSLVWRFREGINSLRFEAIRWKRKLRGKKKEERA